jgi:6-phosphofructokinase 1
MVEYLKDLGVGILFAIGGDGTLRGAQKIGEEAARRGLTIGVIGVPKTIDNDISFVQRTFGFETAVTEAWRATAAADAEAEAARNGIGLVKLMGRDSGFIAAYSALVNNEVNFCLIPEVPFTLKGFLSALQQRLERRSHAVIVVAEGAGQDLMSTGQERDASGNVKHGDIGVFLRDAITDHFKRAGTAITLKYLDPGYAIRSVPATAHDSAFCLLLAQSAVHAGLSGRTNIRPRGIQAQEDRPGGRLVEQRSQFDRSAARHGLIVPAMKSWITSAVEAAAGGASTRRPGS